MQLTRRYDIECAVVIKGHTGGVGYVVVLNIAP